MRHKLLEKDLASLTGVCQKCGPVELAYRADRDYYCCKIGRAERNRTGKKRNILKFPDGHRRPNNEEIAAMISGQDRLCALCERELTKDTHVDHCHETGRIRGVLCRSCNIGLGMFNEDPEMLRKAIAYITP